MPGTTPAGYPYAEPTDPLVQWPATSQSLAQKLDDTNLVGSSEAGLKLAAGGVAGAPIAAGANRAIPVTFPVGLFTVGPHVVACNAGIVDPDILVNVSAITAAGATIHMQNVGTVERIGGALWIAAGV
jgi:hypothetical protein